MATRTRSERGFWAVAAAFLVGMAFSTVPAPLYALYQAKDGFSSFVVTVVFAAYAVGVIASLFLAGHVSDWLGRRRVLAAALAVEMLAAVVFLLWTSVPALIVARVLTGLGVGALTATATAYLAELHAASRPEATRRRADVVGAAVNMGGLGLGTFVAGLLAEHVAAPLRTPYAALLAVLALVLAAVLASPETVVTTRRRYRTQRISVPSAALGTYAYACGAAFSAFAVFGLFTSLAPTFLSQTLGHPSRSLAGGVGLLVFGAGALSQVVFGRLSPTRQLSAGTVGVLVGLPLVVVSVYATSLWLLLGAGLLTGAAVGVLLRGGLTTTASLAAPESRGETLAGFFLVGYVGLVVPVLGLGIATEFLALKTALLGFAVVILAVLVAVSVLGRRSASP